MVCGTLRSPFLRCEHASLLFLRFGNWKIPLFGLWWKWCLFFARLASFSESDDRFPFFLFFALWPRLLLGPPFFSPGDNRRTCSFVSASGLTRRSVFFFSRRLSAGRFSSFFSLVLLVEGVWSPLSPLRSKENVDPFFILSLSFFLIRGCVFSSFFFSYIFWPNEDWIGLFFLLSIPMPKKNFSPLSPPPIAEGTKPLLPGGP